MKLVSIPTADVGKAGPLIDLFLPSIARRGRVPVDQLRAELLTGETQAHIVWNPESQQAVALIGTRIILRGERRLGELSWCTGQGRHDWFDLITQLETYMRDCLGCEGIKAVCRPGWSKQLKAKGYRLTHLIMEKDF